MLNWVILIAFHLYYSNDVEYTADKTKLLSSVNKQSQIRMDCCELLSHLYDTYIGWMDKMSSESLNGIFYPRSQASATYKTTTDNHFSTIVDDTTLTPLVNGIQDFLCKINQTTQLSQSSPLKMRQVVTSSTSSGHPISPASARGASAETGKMNPRPVSPNISERVDMFDKFAAQRPASSQALRPTTSSASLSKGRPASPSINRLAGRSASQPSSASAPEIRPLSASSLSSNTTKTPTTELGASQTPANVRYSNTGRQLPPFLQGEPPERAFTKISDGEKVSSIETNDLQMKDIEATDEEEWRVEELRKRLKEQEQAEKKAAEEAIAKQKAAEEANDYADRRNKLGNVLNSFGNRYGIPFTSPSFHDSGSLKKFKGGKPRTRKHNSAKPRTTTIRKRSKHPVNQRRKYTRKARQDCVSGSTKRTKRVKNNLG
jgi:hypothetical protein